MTSHRNFSLAVLPALVAASAVAVAWAGTATALAWADASRGDYIDGSTYVGVALGATGLVVATCLCCWHWGIPAGAGVTVALWQGGTELVRRTPDYGWTGGVDNIVFLVPITAGVVSLVAVVVCAAVGSCSSLSRRRPGPARAGSVMQ